MPAVPPNDQAISDLQRQLVLAQVRILELEDIRDDATTRIGQLDHLLADLQAKANQALTAHDHLQGAHREMLAHRDHLQHLLHVSNQALETTRAQVTQLTADLAAGAERESRLHTQLDGLLHTIADLEQRVLVLGEKFQAAELRIQDLLRQVAELTQLAQARLDRINQLDGELKAMKASRSWRWTQWIRSLERLARGPKPPP